MPGGALPEGMVSEEAVPSEGTAEMASIEGLAPLENDKAMAPPSGFFGGAVRNSLNKVVSFVS